MRKAPKIVLESAERELLKRLSSSRSTSIRLAERSRIVLLAGEGKENGEISEILGMSRQKVGRWRHRYHEHGLAGIEKDAPRPGRKKVISKRTVNKVIKLTTQEKPANATHWSRRLMAQRVNISESAVGRIWQAYGLKPHRVSTFELSNDKHFQEKLEEVVGLYLSPPENAIVLRCDEKSQTQADDRTPPGLPMKRGRNTTMTHDPKRNRTSTLFAALNLLSGEVLGTCAKRHCHTEWLDFLHSIHKNTPKDKEIHIICDNHATYGHPKVQRWLKCHKRFHVHFTPRSASWLNRVERFFRDLSEQQLGRAVFCSVADLEDAVMSYIEKHDQAPAPFIWTKHAQETPEKAT
jgi:transposase